MTQHRNPSITERASRILNTKAGDVLADAIASLTPTINIQPRLNICRSGQALNATSATIFTTPSDKDFYLVSASLNTIKDVTATSALSTITATVDGVARQILSIGGLTLTVQDRGISQNFLFDGIKIDRGTNITVTNSAAVANIRSNAEIQGYTSETTKGD